MEIWKDIIGYEGLYQVSSEGRVKRFYKNGNEKLLKPRNVGWGYLQVSLGKEGKKTQYLLHRLVGMAFIENPFNKPQINHLNGIKTDNRVENLEWCTRSENQLHAYANGLQARPKGEKNPSAKLSNKDVGAIYLFSNLGLNTNLLAEVFKVSPRCIQRIKNRERRSDVTVEWTTIKEVI